MILLYWVVVLYLIFQTQQKNLQLLNLFPSVNHAKQKLAGCWLMVSPHCPLLLPRKCVFLRSTCAAWREGAYWLCMSQAAELHFFSVCSAVLQDSNVSCFSAFARVEFHFLNAVFLGCTLPPPPLKKKRKIKRGASGFSGWPGEFDTRGLISYPVMHSEIEWKHKKLSRKLAKAYKNHLEESKLICLFM